MARGEIGVEETLAQFVLGLRWDGIPSDVKRISRLALLDVTICVRAGIKTEVGKRFDWGLAAWAGDGPCTVAGGGSHRAAVAAAWSNSLAAHVLDFDDNHDVLGGHLSAVMMPAGVAAAEVTGDVTLDELLLAYVGASEATCKVARTLGRGAYASGWHPTSLLGVIGAALISGRLMRLSEDELVQALGLAAGLASGVKANFGTPAKSIQVGHAAGMGVLSAQLAGMGIAGSRRGLSAAQGLGGVLTQNAASWDVLGRLGRAWDLLDPGLVFKLYPCCASTHAALEAAGALSRRHDGVLASEIREIRVEMAAPRVPHVDRPMPTDAQEARFSVQYVVARAWLAGLCRLEDFSSERLADPEVLAVMSRVRVVGMPCPPWEWSAARVLANVAGEIDQEEVPVATGHGRRRPVTEDDLVAKARSVGEKEGVCQELRQLAGSEAGQLSDLVTLWAGRDPG